MFKKLAILIPVLAVTLTGCTVSGQEAVTTSPTAATTTEAPVESSTPAAPAAPTENTEGVATQQTVTMLNELVVANEQDADSYEQDSFKYWVRKNDTGCDTRFAVLKEESVTPMTASGCDIASGEWFSSYDGVTVTDSSKLDIDHMIPRSEAWRSGASTWTADEREAFANDLDDPKTLVAVSFSSNRSKGDKDPANWMPTTDACVYVSDWISVKHNWKLSIDIPEKQKMITILSFCQMDDSTAALLVDPNTVANSDGSAYASESTSATEEAPAAAPDASAAPAAPAAGGNDPQYGSCKEAKSNGFGPYIKGQDPEYDWYRDGDSDGDVCE